MFVLINWTCGSALLVLGVSLWARAARSCPAAVRYRVWWAALAAILVMPVPAILQGAPAAPGAPAPADAFVELPVRVSLAGPLVVAVWAAWTAIALTRLGVAVVALRRIRRSCVPFPSARERRLTHWQGVRARGRRARLMLSPAVGSAAVLAGAPAVIAVAPVLLRHLDDADLDRIVLHEWAHVQRRDDVAQALQAGLLAIAGLHPAVWWATRQLALERELACDERVADATGSTTAYAACLARLASISTGWRDGALVPSALTGSQLAIRITRLVRSPSGRAPRRLLAWSGAAFVALLLAGAAQVPLVGRPAASIAASAASIGIPERTTPPAVPHVIAAGSAAPRRAAPDRSAPRPAAVKRSASPGLSAAEAGAAPPPDGAGTAVRPDTPVMPRSGLEFQSMAGLPGAPVQMTAPLVAREREFRADDDAPWSGVADAGRAIGSGMTAAGRATAGFFTRMGKSIGGAF